MYIFTEIKQNGEIVSYVASFYILSSSSSLQLGSSPPTSLIYVPHRRGECFQKKPMSFWGALPVRLLLVHIAKSQGAP